MNEAPINFTISRGLRFELNNSPWVEIEYAYPRSMNVGSHQEKATGISVAYPLGGSPALEKPCIHRSPFVPIHASGLVRVCLVPSVHRQLSNSIGKEGDDKLALERRHLVLQCDK